MRGFEHGRELVRYDIGPDGIVLAEALTDHEGILVGRPRLSSESTIGREE
jgi:hypothetical protein